MKEHFPTPSESALEEEPSLESKAIIEEFRDKRAGILGKIMNKRAAQVVEKVGLLTPGLDVPALFASAAMGETLSGEELDARSRVNYAATAGFLTISYVLLAMGQHKEALAAKGAAAAFGTIEFGPESYASVIKLAKEHTPSIATFMEKTADFIESSRDPRLTQLELHG